MRIEYRGLAVIALVFGLHACSTITNSPKPQANHPASPQASIEEVKAPTRKTSDTSREEISKIEILNQDAKVISSKAIPEKTTPEKTTPEKVTPKKADSVKAKPVQIQPGNAQQPTVIAEIKPKTSETSNKPAIINPLPSNSGRLFGKVELRGKDNDLHKPSNIIVSLHPLQGGLKFPTIKTTHEVDMKNKTYTPVARAVLKGDALQFNNHDNIKHNVFSSSGDNTFDLGTFKGGNQRTVTLQHPGIVKVYCNIHPEMATFVMVTESPLHAISNDEGEFNIANVPPGKYTLQLWHIRGEASQDITVQSGDNSLENLVIDVSDYQRVAHKNKFGKDYKKKPALFEDEFY